MLHIRELQLCFQLYGVALSASQGGRETSGSLRGKCKVRFEPQLSPLLWTSPESCPPLSPTPSSTQLLGFKRINSALQRNTFLDRRYLLRGTFLRQVKSWAGRICLLIRSSLKRGFSPTWKGEPYPIQYSRSAELQSKVGGSHCLKFYIFPKLNSMSPLWTVVQGLLYRSQRESMPYVPPQGLPHGKPGSLWLRWPEQPQEDPCSLGHWF